MVKNSVRKVLAFFQIFPRATGKRELQEFLGADIFKLENETSLQCEQSAGETFLALPTAGPDIFKQTAASLQRCKKVLKSARSWCRHLRLLPHVRGVAVCNSVAMGTAAENSDIDLFIVCAPGRVWAARIFVTALLTLLGKRRHGRKVAGRFCLSFFAGEGHLQFERIKRRFDPFLAFWISTLKIVCGREAFEQLANANRSWVKREMGIALRFENDLPLAQRPSRWQKMGERIFGLWFERLCQRLFLPRARRKQAALGNKSGTIISKNILKFHDRDRRAFFAKQFARIWQGEIDRGKDST